MQDHPPDDEANESYGGKGGKLRPEHPAVARIKHLTRGPAQVGFVSISAAFLFVFLRFMLAGKRDLTSFVVAGSKYVNLSKLPSSLSVLSGSGYDGQFYYRLAVDPFVLSRSHGGITFDTPFRAQRIGYPFLSWLVSLGRPQLVPAAMILVNLLAIFAIGYFGAKLATHSGHHPIVGLILVAFPGYLFSIGRDLTEPTAAALLLGAIVFIIANRSWIATACLTASLLTRETGAILVGALFFIWVLRRIRGSEPADGESQPFYLWLIPGFVFLLWQLVVKLSEGHTALKSDIVGNLSIPFRAMISGILQRLSHPGSTANVLWLVQLAALVLVTCAALMAIRSSKSPAFLRLSLVLMVALTVSLSSEIWANSSDFRSLDLLWLLGWITIFWNGRTIPKWWAIALVPTAMTGLQLILFI